MYDRSALFLQHVSLVSSCACDESGSKAKVEESGRRDIAFALQRRASIPKRHMFRFTRANDVFSGRAKTSLNCELVPCDAERPADKPLRLDEGERREFADVRAVDQPQLHTGANLVLEQCREANARLRIQSNRP